MHGHASNYKGKKPSPTYNSWRSMIQRCRNKNHVHNDTYSQLGYCEEWKTFSNFLVDMGERPKGMSLERLDNYKGYSKENCSWASKKDQQRNRKSVVMSTEVAQLVKKLREENHTAKEIASMLGLTLSVVSNVLYRGDWQ